MLWPWPLNSDFEKQYGSSSYDGDQVYQVVWPWSFWFGLYLAYKVFLLWNAIVLNFDPEKQYSSPSQDGDQVYQVV
jgi:hypothetical protein